MYLSGIVVVAVVSLILGGGAAPADVTDVTTDTELLLAFMIHRHGDRTPVDAPTIAEFSNNPEALLAQAEIYGYGQLTNQGKQRAFRMGQFIRRRYNDLLSSKYNTSEIFIQSTDVTRTEMSVLTAMAAVYPPVVGDTWSDTINWEPVPYTTNNVIYDPNTPLNSCPTYSDFINNALNGPSDAMAAYSSIISQVAAALNPTIQLQDQPVLIYEVYDLLRSQVNLDIPLSKELEEIWTQIQDAAGEAMNVSFGDLNYVNLMSDLIQRIALDTCCGYVAFRHKFFDYSNAILTGADTPRVRVYSAHDVNVYSLQRALRLSPNQGVPRYSSLLSLELRRDASGNVFVLPVYLPTPEEPEIYLQVEGCGGPRCSLDQFTSITSKYALDVETWRTLCQATDISSSR